MATPLGSPGQRSLETFRDVIIGKTELSADYEYDENRGGEVLVLRISSVDDSFYDQGVALNNELHFPDKISLEDTEALIQSARRLAAEHGDSDMVYFLVKKDIEGLARRLYEERKTAARIKREQSSIVEQIPGNDEA